MAQPEWIRSWFPSCYLLTPFPNHVQMMNTLNSDRRQLPRREHHQGVMTPPRSNRHVLGVKFHDQIAWMRWQGWKYFRGFVREHEQAGSTSQLEARVAHRIHKEQQLHAFDNNKTLPPDASLGLLQFSQLVSKEQNARIWNLKQYKPISPSIPRPAIPSAY